MGKVILLDPGHGGVIDGEPQTSGKRSPEWPDGTQLFEGVFNRAIAKRIEDWAPLFGVDCLSLVHTLDDLPLSERVGLANGLAERYPDTEYIYVSIHANAGGGHGIEVFTSPEQTRSDAIAEIFIDKLGLTFPDVRKRTDLSDGDQDKEAPFYVLTKTTMPAILTENFFMDNEKECKKYLMTEDGRDRIALAHLAAMVEIDREVG